MSANWSICHWNSAEAAGGLVSGSFFLHPAARPIRPAQRARKSKLLMFIDDYLSQDVPGVCDARGHDMSLPGTCPSLDGPVPALNAATLRSTKYWTAAMPRSQILAMTIV